MATTSFPLNPFISFLSSKKYSYERRKLSKFSHCQTDSPLKILNSLSVTNVTSGYKNVFDWLANQLTLKQDRTFAMIGQ